MTLQASKVLVIKIGNGGPFELFDVLDKILRIVDVNASRRDPKNLVALHIVPLGIKVYNSEVATLF